MPEPTNDQILASAARYLIDRGQDVAAQVLLSCSLLVRDDGIRSYRNNFEEIVGHFHAFTVTLRGPRLAYELLQNDEHTITRAIRVAFEAVLPSTENDTDVTLIPRAEMLDIDPDWRNELLEIARGRGAHNQGVRKTGSGVTIVRNWSNLNFASESEIRIAQALDRAGVLFMPNCKARVNTARGRENREPDFVVCYQGKWGILEVDGEPFHPPSRTTHDHERDRLFKTHGVSIVEHFDANDCYNEPDRVVREFLEILKRA